MDPIRSGIQDLSFSTDEHHHMLPPPALAQGDDPRTIPQRDLRLFETFLSSGMGTSSTGEEALVGRLQVYVPEGTLTRDNVVSAVHRVQEVLRALSLGPSLDRTLDRREDPVSLPPLPPPPKRPLSRAEARHGGDSIPEESRRLGHRPVEVALPPLGIGLPPVELERALQRVRQQPMSLGSLSLEIRNNKIVVLEAVRLNWQAIQFASKTLKNDYDILKAAYKQHSGMWRLVAADCENTKFVIKILRKDPNAAQFISSHLLTNDCVTTILLDYIEKNSWFLHILPTEFKKDSEFMLAAISKNIEAFHSVDPELQNSEEFTFNVLSIDGLLFLRLQPRFQNERFVKKALSQNGLLLQHILPQWRRCFHLCSTAVQQDGMALRFVLPECPRYEEVAGLAARKNGLSLECVPAPLKANAQLVYLASCQNVKALRHADESLTSDRNFMTGLIERDGRAFEFASVWLRGDVALALKAFRNTGLAIKFASAEIKRDRTLSLEAIRQNAWAAEWIDPELKRDREFMLQAFQANPLSMQFADDELKRDRNFMLRAMRINTEAIRWVDKDLKKDLEFMRGAVQCGHGIITYMDAPLLTWADPSIKYAPSLVIEAFKTNPRSFAFVCDRVANDVPFMMAAIPLLPEIYTRATSEVQNDPRVRALYQETMRLRERPRVVPSVSVPSGESRS